MVKLAAFIPGMAAILGVDKKSVNVCARHLRAAGLITTGGRGPGGAEMQASDATNLVLGLMASNKLKNAPETVKHYREADISPNSFSISMSNPGIGLPVKLRTGNHEEPECLGEVLDLLFEIFANPDGPILESTGLQINHIDMRARQDAAGYELIVIWSGDHEYHMEFWRDHPEFDGVPSDKREEKIKELVAQDLGKMHTETSIDDSTMSKIGALLAGRQGSGDTTD